MSDAKGGPHQAVQARFLAVLPRIELHTTIYFRDVRCPDMRADYVQETIALAWRYFARAVEQGKDPLTFVSQIATFAARHARAGRRVCGQEKARDVMSPLAQRRHRFTVRTLPISTTHPREQLYSVPHGQRLMDAVEEHLRDNTLTPVPEQVSFRVDWPAWLTTRTERDRRIIDAMSLNHRTQDLARMFGTSPSRISQLRREYHDDWLTFADDLGEADNTHPNA